MFANSVLAADVAAGLAARLDAGLNWDLADVVNETARSSASGPRCRTRSSSRSAGAPRRGIALFRAGSFDAVATGGGAPQVEDVAVELEAHSRGAKVVDQQLEESTGPSIEDADVIVAGGIGLGAAESFTLAEELARALAARSARRAPPSTPAGIPTPPRSARPARPCRRSSTSRSASPARSSTRWGCRARGRSSRSTRIANAPIFEFSDLAVVGDVHEIVPKLTELVKQRKRA